MIVRRAKVSISRNASVGFQTCAQQFIGIHFKPFCDSINQVHLQIGHGKELRGAFAFPLYRQFGMG